MSTVTEYLSREQRIAWIEELMPHIQAVFAAMNDVNMKRKFAVKIAGRLSLTAMQRKRLTIPV